MPEGPEAKNIARKLNDQIAGLMLATIHIEPKRLSPPKNDGLTKRKSKSEVRDPELNQLSSLLPLKLNRVYSRGKKIIFELSSSALPNLIHIVCSLGMTGSWIFNRGKYTIVWFELGRADKIGTIDCVHITTNVYYNDQRSYGDIRVAFNSTWFSKLMAGVGHDLMSDETPPSLWLFELRKHSTKEICWVLMNQKIFAGVGNYIKAEALYRSKIRPDRLVQDIDDDKLILLLESILDVIDESYQANGKTIKDYVDPNGDVGSFKCQVYNQTHDPDGHLVRKDKFSDRRTTHWVPEIQL
jgi:formamidopyrimidine-DNA glycosylase